MPVPFDPPGHGRFLRPYRSMVDIDREKSSQLRALAARFRHAADETR
jgi:hypothetical protein